MAGNQGRPKPGDKVERGDPSWLSSGGTIVFGARRPSQALSEIEPPRTTADDFSQSQPDEEMPGTLTINPPSSQA